MIEIKLEPKHKAPIQRITLAQTEDKKEKGIVLSVMNDGNQGNQVINARFQDCIFFRVCNNPKHNLKSAYRET